MGRLKLALGNILVFFLMCLVVELAYSTYRYLFRPLSSYSVFEHNDQTYRFDPFRGVFLTRVPSRFARLSYGHIAIQGTYRGNNQGFPDRNDFTPTRSTANQKRFAVLGDSFTAAQYISRNWPERVEDVYAKRTPSLELLNFSLDGTGLANWASILRNIIAKDHYELDGLIFAVWSDDLDRKFKFYLQINERIMGTSQVYTWDIAGQPTTLSDARKMLRPMKDAYVVSSAEFDAALAGGWRPRRIWHFTAFDHVSQLASIVSKLLGVASQVPIGSTTFEPGQLALIEAMKEFAQQQSLPVLVVYIPSLDELIQPEQPSNVERVRHFSQILGATFLDGREAFKDLSKQQIKAGWMVYDAHWNQAGSDRFAEFMAQKLQAWPRTRDHGLPIPSVGSDSR